MAKTAFKGAPVTLAGEFVKVGTSAPEFTLVKGDLSNYTLKDGKGKYLILNIFPSLDTGVCATSVRKFNQLAANQPNTVVLAISKTCHSPRAASAPPKGSVTLFLCLIIAILPILLKNMVF